MDPDMLREPLLPGGHAAGSSAAPIARQSGPPGAVTTPPGVQSAARTGQRRPQAAQELGDEEVEPTTKSILAQCLFSECCRRKNKRRESTRAATNGTVPARAPWPGLPWDSDVVSPRQLVQAASGVWLSKLLSQMWPSIAAALEAQIATMLPGIVEANRPAWMEGFMVDRITLGSRPPEIRSARVDNADDDSKSVEVTLMLGVKWTSESDVQITVKPLPAGLTSLAPSIFRGVVSWMTSITVGLQALTLEGDVLVTLGPLISSLPPMRAVQVSFAHTPTVDFNITLTRGESHALNLLKPWLRSSVASAFAPFIMPERMPFPFDPEMPDQQNPEGALLVQVLRAENVPKMDYIGHSDTYVDVWVRGRIKRRTPTIKVCYDTTHDGPANPEWTPASASFVLLVHRRRYQTLNFELWDEDEGLLDALDDHIGACTLALTDLQPGKEHTLELKVTNQASRDQASGVDPAHAGGKSRVNVSATRLHVKVRYVPAALAPLLPDEVGRPGVLQMKLKKITVPNLSVLPLRARPTIIGQQPACFPPLSSLINPLRGKDPDTGEDLSTRHELPSSYDAVWDVLGDAAHISSCVFVLEMVADAGSKSERVAARVQVPFNDILSRPMPTAAPPGAAGGPYTLQSDTGLAFDLELIWSPLLSSDNKTTSGGDAAAEAQQLLHSTTSPFERLGSDVAVGSDSITHSTSMPNVPT